MNVTQIRMKKNAQDRYAIHYHESVRQVRPPLVEKDTNRLMADNLSCGFSKIEGVRARCHDGVFGA